MSRPEAPRLPPGDPLYGVPSAADLLAAVREFLDTDVRPVTDGHLQFQVRVAANVLAVVERQLAAADADLTAQARRLAGAGLPDDAALAAAIRAGDWDGRDAELRALLTPAVADRLAVANPRYAAGPRQGDRHSPPDRPES